MRIDDAIAAGAGGRSCDGGAVEEGQGIISGGLELSGNGNAFREGGGGYFSTTSTSAVALRLTTTEGAAPLPTASERVRAKPSSPLLTTNVDFWSRRMAGDEFASLTTPERLFQVKGALLRPETKPKPSTTVAASAAAATLLLYYMALLRSMR